MSSFYVAKKSNGHGWRLMETVYKDGKRKPSQVPKSAYQALGFRFDMSDEEAKARVSQLNKVNRVEKSKVIAIARRVELESVSASAYVPKALAEAFVQKIKDDNFGSDTHCEKRLSHWQFVQDMVTTLQLEPKDFADNKRKIFGYFIKRKISLDYAGKIRRTLNEWGYFVSKQRGQFFEPVGAPKGIEKEKIADSNETSEGKRRPSEKLTEKVLADLIRNLPDGHGEYLSIALYFGLRPSEIQELREKPEHHRIDRVGKTVVLRIYQSKLSGVAREKRWKVIPVILDQQKQALQYIEKDTWSRPLARTLQRLSGVYLTRYCGRKGFTDLMLGYGQELVDISAWLGHTTINRTYHSYKDKQEVTFSPVKKRKAS